MRDELIGLAQRQVLQQALGHPFHLLPIELAQQTTGAGTAFLRWRKHDRSAMGVALWQELMASTSTPVNLLADLHAIELQRITLNMQISLLHTLGRLAQASRSPLPLKGFKRPFREAACSSFMKAACCRPWK